MTQILRKGTVLTGESSGATCTVGTLIGSGGQGEVYRGTFDGADVAVKWYYPPSATPEQHTALLRLVESGPPGDKFLWPVEVVLAEGGPHFGYVMTLREGRFRGMPDLLRRKFVPTFRALTTAAAQLAESFRALHSQGLCYRDISLGNVFFDPRSGDVLICDNDNCSAEGEAGGILGTPDFMAPEIVRGEALPTTNTDLFSLAVLLFIMLVNHHPLSGRKELDIRCLDLPAKQRLFGTQPVFIFDPVDDSNRPHPIHQANAGTFWDLYPEFIRNLFVQAFTMGVTDPVHGRVREGTWREAMLKLRDLIFYCTCGASNFYDPGSSGRDASCWHCGRHLRPPMQLTIGKSVVMLNHDSILYPHHVDRARKFDFSVGVAHVLPHPADPNVWGLKNLTDRVWQSTSPAGVARQVPPGRSVTLAPGTHISFGGVEAEVT